MTAAPNGQNKAAGENEDAVKNAGGSPAEAVPLPTTAPGINAPVGEGEVQVIRGAKAREAADPAGKVTVTKKATTKPRKKDVLAEHIPHTKLPVAVTVGQITVAVEEYAGRPVASLSLVGWVGDAPLKVLAEDLNEIERAIEEIRKQLS